MRTYEISTHISGQCELGHIDKGFTSSRLTRALLGGTGTRLSSDALLGKCGEQKSSSRTCLRKQGCRDTRARSGRPRGGATYDVCPSRLLTLRERTRDAIEESDVAFAPVVVPSGFAAMQPPVAALQLGLPDDRTPVWLRLALSIFAKASTSSAQ